MMLYIIDSSVQACASDYATSSQGQILSMLHQIRSEPELHSVSNPPCVEPLQVPPLLVVALHSKHNCPEDDK